MKQFDVLIIGAGAVGNAVAREISKQNTVSVGVLEKEPDTAFGASGRNSGVLHAGFNNKPGSFMAKLCVQGSEGFEQEAAELGVPFRRTGKLVVARFEEDLERLQKLKAQGEANGVRGLRIVGREELTALAGYEAGAGALWSGMTGVFDPFLYTVALAEAAVMRGAEYRFGRQVTGIAPYEPRDSAAEGRRAPQVTQDGPPDSRDSSGVPRRGGFLVTARNLSTGEEERYRAGVLINSAGLFADKVCRMAGIDGYKIYPCRGEYHILDKKYAKQLPFPIYPIPNEKEGGLGVHLTPAIHGNILVGPSAEYLEEGPDREEYGTTRDVMDQLTKEGTELFPGLERKDCIRSFAGVRPKLVSEKEGGYADFIIEESRQVPGFIMLVGIESPGLTASIPIAKTVTQITDEIMRRNRNAAGTQSPNGNRTSGAEGGGAPDKSTGGSRADGGAYGFEPGDRKMLCRCEGITEAAVLAAYDRILKIGAVPTVKGLKNRTRVTMGNCQGSFCTVNIVELLQKKRNVDPLTLLWNGFGSMMFEGRVRE
jgi:glycerol-3-phosphate dehydrogenase